MAVGLHYGVAPKTKAAYEQEMQASFQFVSGMEIAFHCKQPQLR
jgi:hypothetical protein